MNNFIKNINSLQEIARECNLCPQRCGVNRLDDEKGFCNSKFHPFVADSMLHFYEESLISGTNGSGAIFFSCCNMNCLYCQNHEISNNLIGLMYPPEDLAHLMLSLEKKSVHNINLISPTHNIASIAKAIYIAKTHGLNIPVIYNSGGYENISTIDLLEDLIDIYMPDFKYADSMLSYRLSKAKDYPFYAAISIKKMFEQVGSLKLENNIAIKGLLIRHLVLPGFIDNSLNVLYLIKSMIDPQNVFINIMDQYHPVYKAYQIKKLNKKLSFEEYQYVVEKAKSLGFNVVK